MKKILAVAVAALVSFTAFAGDWQSTLGAGISAQKSSIHVDNDDSLYYVSMGESMGKVHQWAVNFNLTYLLVNTSNGLSFKADFGIGPAIANEDWISSGDIGLNVNGDIGIGYSFIHSKRATLGLFAMFGLDYTKYSWTYKANTNGTSYDDNRPKFDLDYSIFHYKLGTDIVGAFRFNEHLGLFGSFGARWICGGSANISATGSAYGKSFSVDKDWDLKSKGLCFIPTLGFCWTF